MSEGFMLQLSPAIQDMLKHIYLLRRRTGAATNQALAGMLSVKPATVTKMVRRLAKLGYVVHEPYRGAELTESGRRVALEVIRHHRLIELYLVKNLGFSWDEVHSEAESLEHAISEKVERKLVASMNDVRFDPHGHPVPTEDGHIHEEDSEALLNHAVGDDLRVVEVLDADSEALKYIGSLGIFPGSSVKILDKAPFEGPIRVRVDSKIREVTPKLASFIYATSKGGPKE